MVEIFDNIRKIYKFSAPCAELSDYIDFFSESSFEETTRYIAGECFTIKLFPSWTPTIWINLGTPYHLLVGGNKYVIKPQDDLLILRDSIVERQNLPTDHIFSIKFFPGGLEAIFGINQTKLINKVVDLHTIMPADFIDRLKQLYSFEERMEMLQGFFLSQYQKHRKQNYYIKFVHQAIAAYEKDNLEFRNSEIADKMFVTSKTIYRYFTHVIGTTPKHYFFLIRARTALTAYVADKKKFDAFDYGYYDMSHFYKDVVKFTGQKLIKSLY